MAHPISRRSLLTGGATLAGIAAVKAAFAQSMQKLGTPSDYWRFDGGYWARVREQFMTPEGFAYMNTGTLGPTPRPISDALVESWRLRAVNPHENSNVMQNRQEQIRVKAAEFVGALPDEIAITRNTTEGLVTIINGLDLKPGDQVLYSFHDNSSNVQPGKRNSNRALRDM